MFTLYPRRDRKPVMKFGRRPRALSPPALPNGNSVANRSTHPERTGPFLGSPWSPGYQRAGSPRAYGGSRIGTLLVLLAMAGGGVYAYHHFFQRSGEAAIRLIPADALMVVTVDTTPAPGQALLFERIADAVKREGLDTRFDDLMAHSLSESPIARDLHPYIAGSLAFAALKPAGATTPAIPGTPGTMSTAFSSFPAFTTPEVDSVTFVAIKDAEKVIRVLNRDAQKHTVNGLDYYQVTGDRHCLAVVDSYLITADQPEDLARIDAVRSGRTPAIAAMTDYQQARASLPADSNMMLFTSQSALAQGGQTSGDRSLVSRTSTGHAHYIALGMAIHDQGIDLVAQTSLEPPPGLTAGNAGRFVPLDSNLWHRLPSGAYGVLAGSQPGKLVDYVTATANEDPDMRRALKEGIASFERETGLSVTHDLLPGTQGNVALAVYPQADNPQKSVEGLLVMDDANGADPAALAERVRASIERVSEQNGGRPWRFTSEIRNGVTVWRLNPASGPGVVRNGVTVWRLNSASGPGVEGNDRTRTVDSVDIHVQPGSLLDSLAHNFSMQQGADSLRLHRNGLDLHSHEGDSVNIDRNGMNIQSHEGDTFNVDRNRMNIQSHEGDTVNVDRNGIHIRSHDGSSFVLNHNGLDVRADYTRTDPPNDVNNAEGLGNRTLLFAQVGHAVLVTTSAHLLDRALAAYKNGSDTLASEPGFATMRQHIPSGAQNVVLLNLPSILESLRPALTETLHDMHSSVNAQDVLHLFGSTGNGIVASQQYDGTTFKMTLFLPVDYEKVIHLAGSVH